MVNALLIPGRWVVQVHKVRQLYPSPNRHKTIWRGPYIKGPASAPLKAPKEPGARGRQLTTAVG
jgi:hypothetical protein